MNRIVSKDPPLVDARNVQSLEIVLKTVERCNLNCSYCYFFNKEDQSYKDNPAFISMETVHNIIEFLKRTKKDASPSLDYVRIGFHGGEPMLQPKKQFDAMCKLLREELHGLFDLHLHMQTNATLISDEWLRLLETHQFSMSLSLDGPEEIHDRYRVDHKGKGSYKEVIRGLEKLKSSKLGVPGCLCVINPEYDPKVIYRHFVHDLGIKTVDFLLPDFTYETFPAHTYSATNYGNYLCSIFDCWVADDDPSIHLRFPQRALSAMLARNLLQSGKFLTCNNFALMSISSKGDVGPEDQLRNSDLSFMKQLGSIKNLTLDQILNSPVFSELYLAETCLPKDCQNCCWQSFCGGGHPLNRFSKQQRFNQRSVFCEGLKQLYTKIADYLIQKGGLSPEDIMKNLGINA